LEGHVPIWKCSNKSEGSVKFSLPQTPSSGEYFNVLDQFSFLELSITLGIWSPCSLYIGGEAFQFQIYSLCKKLEQLFFYNKNYVLCHDNNFLFYLILNYRLPVLKFRKMWNDSNIKAEMIYYIDKTICLNIFI
jgi:hypothetical protein